MDVTAVKGSSENMWVTGRQENPVTDNKRKTQCLFHPDLYRKSFCTYQHASPERLDYLMGISLQTTIPVTKPESQITKDTAELKYNKRFYLIITVNSLVFLIPTLHT